MLYDDPFWCTCIRLSDQLRLSIFSAFENQIGVLPVDPDVKITYAGFSGIVLSRDVGKALQTASSKLILSHTVSTCFANVLTLLDWLSDAMIAGILPSCSSMISIRPSGMVGSSATNAAPALRT